MNKYLNLNLCIDKKFHGILTISDTHAHREGNPKTEIMTCLKMKTFIINRTIGGYLQLMFGINRHLWLIFLLI